MNRPVGRPHLVIINPLAAALDYYSRQLESVAVAVGCTVTIAQFVEPVLSGRSRISWVRAYLRQLADARRTVSPDAVILVTWPVLGYIDVVLIRFFLRRPTWLVIHDPEPLVRAVGYGWMIRNVARLVSKDVRVIAHSEAAFVVASRQRGTRAPVTLLPHPVFASRDQREPVAMSDPRPIVRVLGQYKPDRDLLALEGIARHINGDCQLEIWGRGWPQVAGWVVNEGFVTESRMTELVATAQVIVIPYTRFFQSGIAMRSIEYGVPVVGPRESSLSTLFGHDSRLLVSSDGHSEENWGTAVRWALGNGRGEAEAAGTRVPQQANAAWKVWLDGVFTEDAA